MLPPSQLSLSSLAGLIALGFLAVAGAACERPSSSPPSPADAPLPAANDSVPTDPGTMRPEGPPRVQGRGGPRFVGLDVTEAQLDQIAEACRLPTEGAIQDAPLVDTHVHIALENPQGPFAIALLEAMNESGVSKAVVQLDHSPGMLDHPGLLSVSRQVEATWGRIAAVCDRILPLVYAFDPAKDSDWDYVAERLATGHYAGVGEIEFHHTKMGIRKPVRTKTMDRVFDALESRGGLLHIQAGTEREPRLRDSIIELVRTRPQLDVLWFGSQDCFEAKDLPNLLCSVFPGAHLDMVSSFSSEAQERVVLGTDHAPKGFHSASTGHLPYEDIQSGVSQAREQLGEMAPDVGKAVASGNFERVRSRQREGKKPTP